MPARATTEPTDRSMPRVRITKVIPMASTPLIDVWSRIFEMLPGVRKNWFDAARTTTKIRNAMKMPYSWISARRRSDPSQPCAGVMWVSDKRTHSRSAAGNATTPHVDMWTSDEAVASPRSRIPTERPARMTMMRSDMPRTSSISDEIITTVPPVAAKSQMIR